MLNKNVDCIELKRKAAEMIYAETKSMTPSEQLRYWKSGEVVLRNLMNSTK